MHAEANEMFKDFANREFPLVEVEVGKSKRLDPAPNNAVYKEMREFAQSKGLSLYLTWPQCGFGRTQNFNHSCVNAKVEKGADGVYRVGTQFTIG